MKIFALILFFPLSVLCVNTLNQTEERHHEWRDFKIKFSRSFNESEETKRFKIFEENCEKIQKHNELFAEGKESFRLGINRYGDMTYKEIVKMHTPANGTELDGFYIPENYKEPETLQFDDSLETPESWDWREKGAVSSVKDQLPCGSCWAHAAIACTESQYFIQTGIMLDLSEQELVDCVGENAGCNGGDASFTYNYMLNHFISLEKDYPYTAKDGVCKINTRKSEVKLTSYAKLGVVDEDLMKKAIAQFGPTEVSISFVHEKLMRYSDGVYSDPECDGRVTNHAVQVVGFGRDEKMKIDYWIIKNSWAKEWGENGFIRIARNKGNMCGIAKYVYVPLLTEQKSMKSNFILIFGTICAVAILIILIAFCYLIAHHTTADDDESFDDGRMEELNKELIVFSSGKSTRNEEQI